MLFLSEDVCDARIRLKSDLDSGKASAEATYQKSLELDPYDYIALLELGRLRQEAGDLAAAEEYFWRAIHAHPCIAFPYIALAQLLHSRPESAALSDALGELGIAKRALDDESFLDGVDLRKAGIRGAELKKFKKLPAATQGRLIAAAMRVNREDEPEEVTARLRQLRLLQQMQEDGDLAPETVDEILAEGESFAPLLVGVLRGWAQELLGEGGDCLVENALGLLGEAGTPSDVPHLLEFVDLQDENVSGAARWALGRIIERRPMEAALVIESIAAGLGPAERLVIAEQMLRHPELDPAGSLLQRLGEGLDSWKKADLDVFFPLFLGSMAAARGKEGVRLGRAALRRHSDLLSRDARRECISLLADFEILSGTEPVEISPSPINIYDICAGNAVWDSDDELDDGDGEDDEWDDDEWDEDLEPDIPLLPEPVRRKAAPGRNDPCWCNSGKKYKKCHLESDERRDRGELPPASPAASDANEFTNLRRRIGEFLGQALPEREFKLAIEELFGGEVGDPQSANLTITDWLIHDRIAPSLGRSVIQEFFARHGSRLTPREREMVEAWSRSFVGLYEVQELTPGAGLTLKDLIFGETFFVHDVNMSTVLVRWDGLLTRVVPGERGVEVTGTGLSVPRHSLEPLRQWMEEDRAAAGLEWREYLKANWPRIRRQSFEIAGSWAESVRLSNTDGDELLFSQATYAITDETAAIVALRGCPEFEAASSDDPARESFVWLNPTKTVLGNIRIAGDQLVLECNSRQRAERGKKLLASIAGESLRHLRDEFTTMKELKSRAAAAPRSALPKEPEIPKGGHDEIITQLLDQHYSAWPDTKLPALNGKTPRQASRTAKGRKQVIAILKDIENGEDRKRRSGEPVYDVARLRAELGFDS